MTNYKEISKQPQGLVWPDTATGLAGHLLTMPVDPCQQEATQRPLYLQVDLAKGHAWVVKAEERPSPSEKPVQLADKILPVQFDKALGHLMQPLPCALHGLDRRHFVQLAPRTICAAVGAKGEAQKIRAFFRPSNDACLVQFNCNPKRCRTPST